MKKFISALLILYTISSPYLMPQLGISDSFAWPAVAAGMIAALILYFNDIKTLSFDKYKIEMRDKLDEAQAIIASLKTFAASLAEHTITDLMAGCFGFQGGIGRYKRFELKDKIVKTLEKIGFKDVEVKEIEERSCWQNGVKMIYWNAISHVLEKRDQKGQINANEAERRKISQELSSRMKADADDFTEWEVLSADEIEKYIIDKGFEIDGSLKNWLNDYKNYLVTGNIGRRKDLLLGNYGGE